MSQQDTNEHIETYQDPIQLIVQDLADSIASSIDTQEWDAINEKTRLLIQLMDVRERYMNVREGYAARSIGAEIERVHSDMDQMHSDMNKLEEKLTSFLKKGNFWARMIPLFLVAVAIVAYPFYGMVTHMAPQSLVQYLTPVSGLAGAIIGYWFGRQGESP